MFVTKDVKYIGVNDFETDLFEGQYLVPDGMAYNSYVIFDDKVAVMDTVDRKFGEEWLDKLVSALDGRLPDYLVIHHMEPDHSANIARFASLYPDARIVASQKAFAMMKGFFGTDYSERRIVVGDGDTLSLGSHNLTFVTAPMVHWPEVILSYDAEGQILFSADAFGKFGAIGTDAEWACEARRYYFGIVGKYGPQVQNLLKKLSDVRVSVICPLHGPVLSENIGYYVSLYDTWSSYRPEEQGVTIAYTSVYGNTERAALMLAEKLVERGITVAVHDLARTDMAEAVEDAFRYSTLVLATTTYNADIFPHMKEFISHLTERNYQNRTVGLIENGSWAPMAVKVMTAALAQCKNLTILPETVKITSALNSESTEALNALASAVESTINNG